MLIQSIGVLLGITGFIVGIPTALVIGGLLCIVVDVIGFSSGKLSPGFPIVLYIGGYIITQSWVGVLYGSIIGNAVEAIPVLIILAISSFKKK